MALAKKTSSSSRVVVVSVVIVVIAGIGFLLFRAFFLNAGNVNSINALNPDRAVISNFGDTILNDSRFTQLRQNPVTINADANTDGGQPNPFQ